MEPLTKRTPHIPLGCPEENPSTLTTHDIRGDVVWDQLGIAKGTLATGEWAVKLDSPGMYSFKFRRWPRELGMPINYSMSKEEKGKLAPWGPFLKSDIKVDHSQFTTARLKIFGQEYTIKVDGNEEFAEIELGFSNNGETMLEAYFYNEAGGKCAPYYLEVEKL